MSINPHALDHAQDAKEEFEILENPPNDFDPYKDRPKSSNTFATRAEAHAKGRWHASVHIWIVKEPSLILLQKRSEHKDTFPGRWDISAAGHIEAGNSNLNTAQSELAEELGVDLTTMNAEEKNNTWDGGLKYAFTIPAEQAPLGGCNAYENVYFLKLNDTDGDDIDHFKLGEAEVSGIAWKPCIEVLRALNAEDQGYAPRTKQYVTAMEKELRRILGDCCMM